jgi:mannose-6-phosphate isomerase-like protein (cupin superfamily)
MITKLRIDPAAATAEFGIACQRIIPWTSAGDEPPLGAMACFLDAGASSAPDLHDQDEVMLVLAGKGTVLLDDEREPIAAGDVVVLERNREHTVVNDGLEALTWIALYWPLHEPRANS